MTCRNPVLQDARKSPKRLGILSGFGFVWKKVGKGFLVGARLEWEGVGIFRSKGKECGGSRTVLFTFSSLKSI